MRHTIWFRLCGAHHPLSRGVNGRTLSSNEAFAARSAFSFSNRRRRSRQAFVENGTSASDGRVHPPARRVPHTPPSRAREPRNPSIFAMVRGLWLAPTLPGSALGVGMLYEQ